MVARVKKKKKKKKKTFFEEKCYSIQQYSKVWAGIANSSSYGLISLMLIQIVLEGIGEALFERHL